MENWPILSAFLALQTLITSPILGFVIKQNMDLRAEKDARIADHAKIIANKDQEIKELKDRRDAEVRELNQRRDAEIAALKAERDELMEMAFDAVRGFSEATGAARETVQVVRTERARRS
jgi:hypothetical protein